MSDALPLSRRSTLAAIGAASVLAAPAAGAQGIVPESVAGRGGNAVHGRLSVLDYGADPTGRNDSSPAFRRALADLAGGHLDLPPGRFLVERIFGLAAAGQKIVGASRWKTLLVSERGGGPLFASDRASSGTSAFHLLSDFAIDLNGNDGAAIDLSSINCTTVARVHIKGGSASRPAGTGIRFGAPLDKGAYDNAVHDCSFEYLQVGVAWGNGANNNSLFNCRLIGCGVALDAAPGGELDTPRVFGGRIESCGTGIVDGAHCGAYFAVRFEGNSQSDIRFTDRSENAQVWGGFTATTPIAIAGLHLATSPSIDSSELGYLAIEESPSRPRVSTGRHVFAPPGKVPGVILAGAHAAQFDGSIIMRQPHSIDFANAADDIVRAVTLSPEGRLSITGQSRATGSFAAVELGGGPAVHPVADAITDLGATRRRYRQAHISDAVHVGGRQVLGPRQPPIADDPGQTETAQRVNRILGALRAHGLIGQ